MKRFNQPATLSRWICVLALGLSLSGAFTTRIEAQPKPPTLANLKEEQRKADIAYLNEAESEIRTARERLGGNEPRLAQISGFRALAKLGRAREILDPHPERIEELRRIFLSESSRKDLRANYTKVRDHYNSVEERIESIAEALDKVGYPILKKTLGDYRAASSPAEAMNAIGNGAAAAGASGGDIPPATNPPAASISPSSSGVSLPSGFSTAPGGAGVVTPGGNTIPGTVLANGKVDGGPGVGIIDLNSRQVNKDGVEFFQTSEGVWMTPPGILLRGAKLNPDGTITFADGSTSAINDVKRNADGTITVGNPPRSFNPATGRSAPSVAPGFGGNGHLPSGTKVYDQNGKEVTVTRPFKDGVALEVEAKYLGAANTILQREEKIELRMVSSEGSTVRVKRTAIESRSWSLRVDFKSAGNQDGKLTGTIGVVDAAGAGGLEVKSIEVSSDDGSSAPVQRGSEGAPHTVTFAKSGDYTAVATGETDWGSTFKIEAILPIGL